MVEDYIIFRLTGLFATEHSLNCSTLYFDIVKKAWWKDMLTFLNINENQLPAVHPSGEAVALISESVAKEIGVPVKIKIVTGAFDHVAGAIGAGNIHAGIITETTGASMAIVVTLDSIIENISVNLPIQCHAIAGKYLLLPYAQTAGMMFRWFRDVFCREEVTEAEKGCVDPFDLMTKIAEGVVPGSDGLLVLPHLMGSGSPEFNANAKAVFSGVQLNMGKGHFIRAIMESIAYMIKRNLDTLNSKGIIVNEIRALGGGAKSALWNQMKADITGYPIKTISGQETASIGAAILAGVGCGIFTSIDDGCSKLIYVSQTYLPAKKHAAIYQQQYHLYKLLSGSLENFW